jgi:hypothetical protein
MTRSLPPTLALLFALAVTSACGIPDQGPAMQPGADCLTCHDGNQAPQWTVAGTVFSAPTAPLEAGLQGALVVVTDATNRTLTLQTNEAGNFFTAEALVGPLVVSIQNGNTRMEMGASPSSGSCNSCHNQPGGYPGVPGRLWVPYVAGN